MNERSLSFWQAAWRRLKKNKGAMAGLFMIVFAVLVALFSYVISPDPSPFANRIILEIGGERPGFVQNFLLVKKQEPQKTGFVSQIFSGRPDQFDYIPITSFRELKDSIVAEKSLEVYWKATGRKLIVSLELKVLVVALLIFLQ